MHRYYQGPTFYNDKLWEYRASDQVFLSTDGQLTVTEEQDPNAFVELRRIRAENSRQFMLDRIGEAETALSQLTGHDLRGALKFLEEHFQIKIATNM